MGWLFFCLLTFCDAENSATIYVLSVGAGVLSFASLDSDIYRASPRRQEIQKNGGQTDLVLLKGVSSGMFC